MSIQKLEAELEATRQKIAEQLSMVGRSIQSIDPTLYDKERVLEHEVKHAKTRKLQNARKHWNVAADYVVNLDLEKEQDTTDWKQELTELTYKLFDMPRDKHGYANLMAQLAANNEIDAFIERKILEEPDDEG